MTQVQQAGAGMRRGALAAGLAVAAVIATVSAASAWPAEGAAAAAPNLRATLRVVSPKRNARVAGPTVLVQVRVKGLELVAAGTPLKEGEGHLHFFIDVPASNVKVNGMIPLDSAARYVHAGKPPFDEREIELAPGRHTITVVAANSAHMRIAQPAPVSVRFIVLAPK